MKTYLWKSLLKGTKSRHNNFKWKVDKWYKSKKTINICNVGFHASEYIIDAMWYVPCEVIAKVEVKGGSIKQHDKQCWSEMRIVKKWKWDKEDTIALSIYSASLVLNIFEKKRPKDDRPGNTIKIARKYLRAQKAGKHAKTDAQTREAARNAARDASIAAGEVEAKAYPARDAAAAAVHAGRAVANATIDPNIHAAYAGHAGRAAIHAAKGNKQIKRKIQKWILRRLNSKEKKTI